MRYPFIAIEGNIGSGKTTLAKRPQVRTPSEKHKDKSMKVLPQVLNVSVNFTPIHTFVPNNEIDCTLTRSPLISLGNILNH